MDRKCIIGRAQLEGVEFENGIIEVDIACNRVRSYPGIIFRYRSEGNYERVYIRPHRAPFYPDAIQYTPETNGISGWQLYNGDGYTSATEIPEDEWITLRMEVKGAQARVFFGDMESPALVINDLKHGVSGGTLGLDSPMNGTAYFSNFSYEITEALHFDPPPPVDTPPGTISNWEISPALKISTIDPEKYPGKERLNKIEWQKTRIEPTGLVNVAKYLVRKGREPDCVLARTTIHAEKAETRKFLFGYSDYVGVFLNGKILFFGESAYRQRDPSFLGVVGFFDGVYLPLEKGDNELLLIVTEVFGGWGFMGRDATVTVFEIGAQTVWETGEDFFVPESAVYDSKSETIYISNYDAYNRGAGLGGQFISKLSIDGKIIEKKWVKGLSFPSGMVIHENSLFVVERAALTEIDIESGEVKTRYPFPAPRFTNDVAVDPAGRFYVSDTGKNVIYRLVDGQFEEWMGAPDIGSPNGLWFHDGKLIVGNNSDQRLKSIDSENKIVRVITTLPAGIIDGIKVDKNGNYIVSHGEGRIFRVSPTGDFSKILDVTGLQQWTADFDYIAKKNLLIVPTFLNNKVVAYTLQ
jgi:sugar lactone lactonase YvrE